MRKTTLQFKDATIRRIISLVAISFITATLSIANIYQPLLAQSSGTLDPLSADEIQQTLTAALQAGVANGADSEISAAAIYQEILLVERHRGKKSEIQSASIIRQGDAYVYDYTTDTLKHAIVNLVTGETSVIEEMQYVQLPLTENEVQRALDLAFENESLRTELQNSYKLVSGSELTGMEQLNVKAFVFLAESMPDSVNALSEQCGLHRCAQLLLYTDDDTVLEMQPIVDLSRQIVTQDMANKTALVADDTLIENDNVQESTANLSNQPNDITQVNPDDQTERMFLPIIGRNGFKVERASFEQQLMNWWCSVFGDTIIDDWFNNVCEQ